MADILDSIFDLNGREVVEEALLRLTYARALIEQPEHWTKGTLARNRYREPVGVASPSAECFCVLGAIRCVDGAPLRIQAVVLNAEQPTTPYGVAVTVMYNITRATTGIGAWNDAPERTHEEVLAAFDAAIERCERWLAAHPKEVPDALR